MCKKELSGQTSNRSHYRQINEGEKRRIDDFEVVEIAKVVDKPIVEACTGECSLHCLPKNCAIHYKTYVSEKYTGMG